jgi:hypothetical protein
MDWTVNGHKIDIGAFERLIPDEVLFEFEGPRVFTSHAAFGQLFCFLADCDDETLRYIVVPTDGVIVEKLKKGFRTLHSVLDQPWVWFVDVNCDGETVAVVQGSLSDAPEDCVPQKGMMLWPHLEPTFAMRAIGDGLEEGNVPVSVIRQVVEGSVTALKKITNIVFEEAKSLGRKTNTIRKFYDLPTIGFAYSSFEVAFRFPEIEQLVLLDNESPDETVVAFEKIGSQLRKALEWVESDDSEERCEGLKIELLEALEKLVPPQAGVVKSIELRGSVLGNIEDKHILTREASRKVRKSLRDARSSQEQIVKVTGLVREFDKDELSFTLRETDDGKDHVCQFPADYYDDLLETFNVEQRITISGRENLKTGTIEVSLVSQNQ